MIDIEEFMTESTARAFINDANFIVFGKGGFSKEIVWLLNQLKIPNVRQLIFGEESPESDDFLIIGIADPLIKKAIVSKYTKSHYPNIVAPDVIGEPELGEGNIICNRNTFTVGVKLGNYNAINLNCTIGHGVEIGDFNQINPGTNISGNVKIGNGCLIGTGVQILENLKICDNVIIGAGAVVTKDINEEETYVGVPARRI